MDLETLKAVLVPGERYEFEWKMDYQRRWRATVGTFLGWNSLGDAQINLRPAAGTSALNYRSIRAVWPTTKPITIERLI
jgi:hypothetical protein